MAFLGERMLQLCLVGVACLPIACGDDKDENGDDFVASPEGDAASGVPGTDGDASVSGGAEPNEVTPDPRQPDGGVPSSSLPSDSAVGEPSASPVEGGIAPWPSGSDVAPVGPGSDIPDSGAPVDAGGSSAENEPPNDGVALPPQLTWTRETTSSVTAIWGSGRSDIYAVGNSGSLYHSAANGEWTWQDPGTGVNLTGVWGSGPDDVYVAADSNAILHSAGDGQWTRELYEPGYYFRGLWGLSASDIYLVGPGVVHFTADLGWEYPPQDVTDGSPVIALWGSATDDLYAATGAAGGYTIYHSEGDGDWRGQEVSPTPTAMDAIWGIDAKRIYAAGDQYVYFSSGDGRWEVQLTTSGLPERVTAGWAASGDAVYACTQQGTFYRSNGRGLWSESEDVDPEAPNGCQTIWGTGPDNIYIGGYLGIYHGTL